METWTDYWPQVAFILTAGGGIVVWCAKRHKQHREKHAEIDLRLVKGEEHDDKNDKDHAEIKRKMENTSETLDDVYQGVCELLVVAGKREAGEGIDRTKRK